MTAASSNSLGMVMKYWRNRRCQRRWSSAGKINGQGVGQVEYLLINTKTGMIVAWISTIIVAMISQKSDFCHGIGGGQTHNDRGAVTNCPSTMVALTKKLLKIWLQKGIGYVQKLARNC
ncbi:MAG: hypothetical protein R2932_33370 [Caldilineaceae bacterium]